MTQPHPVRVLLVDDHPVILEGLTALLSQDSRLQVVAEAESGAAAIAAYEQHKPDIVLADLGLPDMSGVELIRRLRRKHPDARVIVLTIHGGGEDVYRAVQAGCRGYLLKNAKREDLFRALETVRAGGRHLSEDVASRLAERTTIDDLTRRELDVLELLAAGKRDREIAEALGVGEPTIRSHVSSIFSKLAVTSRTQATLEAIKLGWVHPR